MSLADYIGTPFAEMDCYALIRAIYKSEHGIELVDPKIRFNDNFKIYHNFMREISKNWKKCEEKKGAVVAICYDEHHPKVVTHFGYCLGNGKFIHTLEPVGAHLEEIKKYKSMIEGYYEYSNNAN